MFRENMDFKSQMMSVRNPLDKKHDNNITKVLILLLCVTFSSRAASDFSVQQLRPHCTTRSMEEGRLSYTQTDVFDKVYAPGVCRKWGLMMPLTRSLENCLLSHFCRSLLCSHYLRGTIYGYTLFNRDEAVTAICLETSLTRNEDGRQRATIKFLEDRDCDERRRAILLRFTLRINQKVDEWHVSSSGNDKDFFKEYGFEHQMDGHPSLMVLRVR